MCEGGEGKPFDPDAFGKAFRRVAAKAGLSKRTRLRDLRHGSRRQCAAAASIEDAFGGVR